MRKFRLLTMEKGDNCLIFSFAMVLGMDPDLLQVKIGHDGLKDVGGTKPCGYHMQELIDVALHVGYAVTPIEAFPASRIPGRQDDFEINFKPDNGTRFLRYLYDNQGVLAGKSKSGIGHAIAWDGDYVYDPKGQVCTISQHKGLDIQTFWMISKIKTDFGAESNQL